MSRSIDQEGRDSQEKISRTQDRAAGPARPAVEDLRQAARTLRETIDHLTKDRPTLPQFLERLRAAGVRPLPSLQRSGRFNGMAYEFRGILIKGSDLGRAYTAQGLQTKKGLRYDPAQHRALLEEAARLAKDRGLSRAELVRPPACVPADRRLQIDGISAAQRAALHEIGRFRTVLANDLVRFQYRHDQAAWRQDAARLAALKLIEQRSVVVATHSRKHGRHVQAHTVVVLTKKGRDLLRRGRKDGTPAAERARNQALYAGLVKPREIAHDAAIYRMYQAEAAALERSGGRMRRIVLDFELKKRVYSPLAKARAQGPAEFARKQSEIAAQNGLKVVQGKIRFPDLRIEYETAAGSQASIDLELATEHYRGDHMSAKGGAGFKIYAENASAPRAGGSQGRYPVPDEDHLVEIFSF